MVPQGGDIYSGPLGPVAYVRAEAGSRQWPTSRSYLRARVRGVEGTNARPKVRTRGRFTPLSQQALEVPLEELGMLGSCGIMPRHELPKRAGGLLIEDRCGSCLRPVRTAASGERRAAIALQKGAGSHPPESWRGLVSRETYAATS